MGEKKNAYRILMEESEGKKPLGRPRHRREDNTKMNPRGAGMDWMDLARDRGR
jgi:hypothetical protein